MKLRILGAAVVAAVLWLGGQMAFAADSCVDARQPDGSLWSTCVDDGGRNYCKSCPAGGGACSRVNCSGSSSQTASISGDWSGYYYYPNNKQPPVRFLFSFAAAGCSGRSSEPNTFGNKSAAYLFANLSCSNGTLGPGQSITITKTYDGTGGVSHSVIYTGTVSQDMRSITGQWAINNARGNFTMSR